MPRKTNKNLVNQKKNKASGKFFETTRHVKYEGPLPPQALRFIDKDMTRSLVDTHSYVAKKREDNMATQLGNNKTSLMNDRIRLITFSFLSIVIMAFCGFAIYRSLDIVKWILPVTIIVVLLIQSAKTSSGSLFKFVTALVLKVITEKKSRNSAFGKNTKIN